MKIADLVAELKFDADTSGLEKAEDGIEDVEGGLGDLRGKIAGGIAGLAALGAAAAAAAVKFAFDLAKGVAEAGDEIAKTARTAGVGADELQRLRFAADRSGAGAEVVTKSIQNLGKFTEDAKKNAITPFTEALGLVGLATEDLEGLTVEEKFGLIADALNDVEDSSERVALSQKLLGEEAGPKLASLIAEGADGIKALGDEAEALGVVMGEDLLGASESFLDSQTNLDGVILGLKASLAEALLPQFERAIEGITTWIQENDQFVKQDLPEIITAIGEALAVFIPFVIDVAVETKNLFTEIKQLDERLTEDLGPAWDLIKGAVMAVLNPIGTLIDLVLKVVDVVGDAVDSLSAMDGVIGGVASSIRDAAEAIGLAETKTGPRGLAGELVNEKGEKVTIDKTVDAKSSSAKLQGVIESPSSSAASKAAARALLPVAASREAAQKAVIAQGLETARKISNIAEDAKRSERAEKRAAAAKERADALAKAKRKAKGGGGGKGKKAAPEVTGIPELDAALAGIKDGDGEGVLKGAGGGASAGSGTTINRIDQSFNAPTNVEVVLQGADIPEGLDPETLAARIGEAVAIQLSERDRQAAEHFKSVIAI